MERTFCICYTGAYYSELYLAIRPTGLQIYLTLGSFVKCPHSFRTPIEAASRFEPPLRGLEANLLIPARLPLVLNYWITWNYWIAYISIYKY